MNLIPLDSKWGDLIDGDWIERLDRSPFLTRCRSGEVTRAELRSFVRQQFYYARHFTRYLCALLSNIESEEDRFMLSQNLFEEMGLGELGEIPHSRIYRRMMEAMGVTPEPEVVYGGTRLLIDRMLKSCRDSDPMVGLGALCLGAEAIVPHLYSQVVHGFEAAGEPREHLEFFRIHIEGDDEHAVTMRAIIERELERDGSAAARLKDAAAEAIAARCVFFEGVSHETV